MFVVVILRCVRSRDSTLCSLSLFYVVFVVVILHVFVALILRSVRCRDSTLCLLS